jgi:hypothetical protein
MIDIEKLEAVFGFEKPNIHLRNLCDTILAKKKNANYCCEYFNRYDHKKKVQAVLNKAKAPLIGQGFDYNIFNRSILRCVFYSLVSNNVSRIDNLEEIMLVLFPEELEKYSDDHKKFSFKKLCKEFPDRKISSVLQAIFDGECEFPKIQNLRDQIAHSTIDGIISNDALVHDEDDYFIDGKHTLSGEREKVADFVKSLNELLLKIEEQIFNCLLTHGKDCLQICRASI